MQCLGQRVRAQLVVQGPLEIIVSEGLHLVGHFTTGKHCAINVCLCVQTTAARLGPLIQMHFASQAVVEPCSSYISSTDGSQPFPSSGRFI